MSESRFRPCSASTLAVSGDAPRFWELERLIRCGLRRDEALAQMALPDHPRAQHPSRKPVRNLASGAPQFHRIADLAS